MYRPRELQPSTPINFTLDDDSSLAPVLSSIDDSISIERKLPLAIASKPDFAATVPQPPVTSPHDFAPPLATKVDRDGRPVLTAMSGVPPPPLPHSVKIAPQRIGVVGEPLLLGSSGGGGLMPEAPKVAGVFDASGSESPPASPNKNNAMSAPLANSEVLPMEAGDGNPLQPNATESGGVDC